MCLQTMINTLTTLSGGAGAGGAPCQPAPAPCQGAAVASPVPMPMPLPVPMPCPSPMPQPMPVPYPEQVIVEPVSCGGTYPCKDKATKSKGKKHQDKKQKKED